MREALLLELVLAAIDAGIVDDEADLVRLYTWLRHTSQARMMPLRRRSVASAKCSRKRSQQPSQNGPTKSA